MERKVLLVDDEEMILRALERLLRRDRYIVITASSGAEAMEVLQAHSDIALIICDQHMPGMTGTETLVRAREVAPETVRMTLTGCADMEILLANINEAGVSRFMLKPWNDDTLRQTVREAVDSFWMRRENERLEALAYDQKLELELANDKLTKAVKAQTAQLAEKTKQLAGSLNAMAAVLAETMELHAPGLRGHARRVGDMSGRLAHALRLKDEDVRTAEMAGLLHDLGQIALPVDLLQKNEEAMSAEESELHMLHPVVGESILREAPGMEPIRQAILHHHEALDGGGYPEGLADNSIPYFARLVAVADAYDTLRHPKGGPAAAKPAQLQARLRQMAPAHLDPEMVDAFLKADIPDYADTARPEVEVPIDDLRPGMRLCQDLTNQVGRALLRKGTVLTEDLIGQLRGNRGINPWGSRVRIDRNTVPAALAASCTDRSGQAETAAAPQATPTPTRRPEVIVVDDEVHMVNALRRELVRAGYDVAGFIEPMEALQHLRSSEHILAFITDYNMPGVRGDRLLTQVQKEVPELPCIVITGQATRSVIKKVVRAGQVKRVLTKPWNKEDLLETLTTLKEKAESST